MDTQTAQTRINAIAAAMLAKGMREPAAQAIIRSEQNSQVYLRWKSGIGHYSLLDDDKYLFFNGDDIAALLDEAEAFIREQPGAEQQKLRDFLTALGECIDLGRKHGIEVDYLSPLEAQMKKLSTNILTDNRAA